MKHQINILLWLLLPCLACSGESLVSPEADASVTETKSLTVQVVHHGTADGAGEFPDLTLEDGTKQFTNDLGIIITLTKAALSFGHLEIISEGDDPECTAAQAHTLHLEAVEDILVEDLSALELATEMVPDVGYCRYALDLTTDNAASPGLSGFPEISGASVFALGNWNLGNASGSLSISINEDLKTEAIFQSLHDGIFTPHPLHFHEGETEKTLIFGSAYDRWFDGVDFEADSEESVKEKVKINVMGNLEKFMGTVGHGH